MKQVLDNRLTASIGRHFDGVEYSSCELQVLSADEAEFYVADAKTSAFALLQVIFLLEYDGSGRARHRTVRAPRQHAVSAWCED